MPSDIFDRERALVERSKAFIDGGRMSGDEQRTAFSELLRGYEKLVKETSRLVKFSDRNEERLKTANVVIEKQRAELSEYAENLEGKVAERTAELAVERTKLERLVRLGTVLGAEHDSSKLMEMILEGARDISNADGGSLYIQVEDKELAFQIVQNDSLNIRVGGTSGNQPTFPAVPLFDAETGEANHRNVVSHTVHERHAVNIADAYESEDFDFSGTRRFDEQTGYRSTSFLTVPLMPRSGEVIGALQLINATDPETSAVVPFSPEVQGFVEALAGQAAVALDNQNLLAAQKALLDSLIELLAGAIDSKSPYTGGHCARVPALAKMLAEAACDATHGPFRDFSFNEDDWYELHIASWLHDCGKVTTSEYVVDKATKLETIYNRIHEIRTRFEVAWRDAEIAYLKGRLAGERDADELAAERDVEHARLVDEFDFVAECNIGGEFMGDDRIERLKEIAARTWVRHFDDRLGISDDEARRMSAVPEAPLPVTETLLMDTPGHVVPWHDGKVPYQDNAYGIRMDVPENAFNLGEVYNLSIRRGTLTDEERFAVNDHIVQTIIMLSQLPWPRTLRRVPEYAGGHHEKLDGTGYPRRLTGEELSLPARIMAIADVFEALTASDRPYKKAKKLSEAVKIMSFMNKDAHVDPDLFDLFLKSGVHVRYAEQFLAPEQVDAVDINQYLE